MGGREDAGEILLIEIKGTPIGAVDVAGMHANKHVIQLMGHGEFVVGIIHQRGRIILKKRGLVQRSKDTTQETEVIGVWTFPRPMSPFGKFIIWEALQTIGKLQVTKDGHPCGAKSSTQAIEEFEEYSFVQ